MSGAKEMVGVSAFRRSSLAVAAPPLQGDTRNFHISQYEIDTSRCAAEGHDHSALSPLLSPLDDVGKRKKTLPHNDAPRSGIKIALSSLTSK
jgi:hypothetical protein